LHSFKLTKLFYRLNPIAQILVWHVFSSFPMALKMKLPAKWSLSYLRTFFAIKTKRIHNRAVVHHKED
jgi:hypothetical protein